MFVMLLLIEVCFWFDYKIFWLKLIWSFEKISLNFLVELMVFKVDGKILGDVLLMLIKSLIFFMLVYLFCYDYCRKKYNFIVKFFSLNLFGVFWKRN